MKKILAVIAFIIGLILLVWLVVSLFNLPSLERLLPGSDPKDGQSAFEEAIDGLPGRVGVEEGGKNRTGPSSSESGTNPPPPARPAPPNAHVPTVGPEESLGTLAGSVVLLGSGYLYLSSRRRVTTRRGS